MAFAIDFKGGEINYEKHGERLKSEKVVEV